MNRCRVCEDVRKPKREALKAAQTQLNQLQQIIHEIQVRKDELSQEIEVRQDGRVKF
jgi:hypothetical protein